MKCKYGLTRTLGPRITIEDDVMDGETYELLQIVEFMDDDIPPAMDKERFRAGLAEHVLNNTRNCRVWTHNKQVYQRDGDDTYRLSRRYCRRYGNHFDGEFDHCIVVVRVRK